MINGGYAVSDNRMNVILIGRLLYHDTLGPVLLSVRTSATRRNETYTDAPGLFVPQST